MAPLAAAAGALALALPVAAAEAAAADGGAAEPEARGLPSRGQKSSLSPNARPHREQKAAAATGKRGVSCMAVLRAWLAGGSALCCPPRRRPRA